MKITPEEVYITYPVTLPLSIFRKAEEAAKHDGQTFNEYILSGIQSDLDSFSEDDFKPDHE